MKLWDFLKTIILLYENTDLYPIESGAPDTRRLGSGLYQEEISLGSLYSESDTFNYKR